MVAALQGADGEPGPVVGMDQQAEPTSPAETRLETQRNEVRELPASPLVIVARAGVVASGVQRLAGARDSRADEVIEWMCGVGRGCGALEGIEERPAPAADDQS